MAGICSIPARAQSGYTSLVNVIASEGLLAVADAWMNRPAAKLNCKGSFQAMRFTGGGPCFAAAPSHVRSACNFTQARVRVSAETRQQSMKIQAIEPGDT